MPKERILDNSNNNKQNLLDRAITHNESLDMGVTTATVSFVTGEKTISLEHLYNIVLDHALALDSTNKSLSPLAGTPANQTN